MVLPNGFDYTERMSEAYPFIDPLKLNLDGKSVFITGASKGVGTALAAAYAQAGASIIGLGARSPQIEIAKAVKSAAVHAKRPEPRVFAYAMDVTDQASVEAAVKQFGADAEGHIDILINNAGYLSTFTPIVESDPIDWWVNYEVNVKGVYLTSRAFLPLMLKDEKSDKTIINLTSIGALHVNPGGSGYQTSKFAVSRFTEFLGAEYGEQGLLAYCVHPGAVATDMGIKFTAVTKVPMVDAPEVCGQTLPFLTSEKRDWLQGRYLSCTWNMEKVLERKDTIVKKDLFKFGMAFE